MNFPTKNNLSFREIVHERTNPDGTKETYTYDYNMTIRKTQDGYECNYYQTRDLDTFTPFKDIRIVDINNGSTVTYIDNIGEAKTLQVDSIGKDGTLRVGSHSKKDHTVNIDNVNGNLITGYKTISNIKNILENGIVRLGKFAIANIETNLGKIIGFGSDINVKDNQGIISEETGIFVAPSLVAVENNSGDLIKKHPNSTFNVKNGKPATEYINA